MSSFLRKTKWHPNKILLQNKVVYPTLVLIQLCCATIWHSLVSGLKKGPMNEALHKRMDGRQTRYQTTMLLILHYQKPMPLIVILPMKRKRKLGFNLPFWRGRVPQQRFRLRTLNWTIVKKTQISWWPFIPQSLSFPYHQWEGYPILEGKRLWATMLSVGSWWRRWFSLMSIILLSTWAGRIIAKSWTELDIM